MLCDKCREILSIIDHVYEFPAQYGATALEVETTLFVLHCLLEKFSGAKRLGTAMETVRSESDKQYGGFTRGILRSFSPEMDDVSKKEVILHVVNCYRRITSIMTAPVSSRDDGVHLREQK
jgi:hypothetical protein